MGNDAENETTQEKGGVGRDAHPGLAGELGNELVAPGEDEERGRLATKRTRPRVVDEEDPEVELQGGRRGGAPDMCAAAR
jgi:hypothetical protein